MAIKKSETRRYAKLLSRLTKYSASPWRAIWKTVDENEVKRVIELKIFHFAFFFFRWSKRRWSFVSSRFPSIFYVRRSVVLGRYEKCLESDMNMGGSLGG